MMGEGRGHGQSEGHGKGGCATKGDVEDIAGVIHVLKLDRPRFIGFSMGGARVLRLAATYPELVHSFIYEGLSDGAIPPEVAISEGYQAWFQGWLSGLEELRTMSYEQRLVSALSQLFPTMGGSLWPEDEYVPMVEANALFDLDLARYSIKLWGSEYQDDPAALLKQVSCPALMMKHAFAFPAPGAQPAVREVSTEQPHIRIVYFDNTGHFI